MRRERVSEKSIGYVRLLAACDRPGCPVCRCVRDDSRGYLDAFIYEEVSRRRSRLDRPF